MRRLQDGSGRFKKGENDERKTGTD
jgi:hypothetical protein